MRCDAGAHRRRRRHPAAHRRALRLRALAREGDGPVNSFAAGAPARAVLVQMWVGPAGDCERSPRADVAEFMRCDRIGARRVLAASRACTAARRMRVHRQEYAAAALWMLAERNARNSDEARLPLPSLPPASADGFARSRARSVSSRGARDPPPPPPPRQVRVGGEGWVRLDMECRGRRCYRCGEALYKARPPNRGGIPWCAGSHAVRRSCCVPPSADPGGMYMKTYLDVYRYT
jgi:hypothetical protein